MPSCKLKIIPLSPWTVSSSLAQLSLLLPPGQLLWYRRPQQRVVREHPTRTCSEFLQSCVLSLGVDLEDKILLVTDFLQHPHEVVHLHRRACRQGPHDAQG